MTPQQRRRLAVDLFNHVWTLLRLSYCESAPDELEDWDLPYAYEALARAHLLAGKADDANRFAEQAREFGARVADPEDREHLEEDLATLF